MSSEYSYTATVKINLYFRCILPAALSLTHSSQYSLISWIENRGSKEYLQRAPSTVRPPQFNVLQKHTPRAFLRSSSESRAREGEMYSSASIAMKWTHKCIGRMRLKGLATANSIRTSRTVFFFFLSFTAIDETQSLFVGMSCGAVLHRRTKIFIRNPVVSFYSLRIIITYIVVEKRLMMANNTHARSLGCSNTHGLVMANVWNGHKKGTTRFNVHALYAHLTMIHTHDAYRRRRP